jgi:type I restriction enzyme S subunit
MQQLLTAGVRLPGFEGEWETKNIEEICRVKKGDLITEAHVVTGDIPVIAGGKQPAYYHNTSNRNRNTITISASGANAGYISFYKFPIFASDCSTIEESDKYNIKFIYYSLLLQNNNIMKMQTGGAQPHIHPRDINKVTIHIPSLNEQAEIANILSDMDSEIEALEHKLSKYIEIKQGMMQELLTGRIRLA